MTIGLRLLGTYNTGVFGQGAAEIPAYDPLTKRLFIVNAQAVTVDVLDVSNPANPVKIGQIDASGLGGVANSVAVKNGILAIAIEASVKTNPGVVAFFQTNSDFSSSVTPVKVVTVGAQPDMVTFTPDGKKVLTANEGEPNSYGQADSVDPEGSVSIIDISRGIVNATVTTANFNAFDGRKDELIAKGVRIFGPNATVSQDLEPEYIAITPDSKTAYVTLQENNAIAVVDIDTATIRDIIPLGFVDHSTTRTKLATYQFQNLPPIGTTTGGQEVLLGGLSGLWFEGRGKDGTLKFITHTDRGPNAEATGNLRPFLLPNFTPEIVRFQLNPTSGEITITQRIQLKRPDGTPLTGLPNIYIPGGTGNTPYNDETPVDLRNNPIYPLDPLGADLEGIAVAKDGTFWMVDEYRPAIYHFDANGTLIERFVPVGTNPPGSNEYGIEALPAVLAQRRQNRGFEAVAIDTDRNKLYAFVQSPIRNPVTLSNTSLNNLNNIRIVEFDLTTKTTTAQYLYRLDNPNLGTTGNTRPDKIGDAVYIGNGEFLVIERDDDAIDSDPLSNIEKKVYRFSLAGATDVTRFTQPIDVGGGVLKTVDEMTPSELAALGINLVKKTLYVDLAAVGYNRVEKVEGLAYLGDGKLAVINDNDFGVANITLRGDGTFVPDPNPEPILLGIIQVQSTALDVSDRDNKINIANWPVFGMFQPDAIAAYQAIDGKIYLVTANEGDARDWPGLREEVRVGSLTLDSNTFPNATRLRQNDQLGRLTVTNTLGDTDGDGDFDKLHVFGTRSFSIWDTDGNLVFDSGSQFEEIIARLIAQGQLPTIAFNANNDDNNSFDTRSDNKGPEPEGVVLGSIRGRTYAFIGLERIGGVMVYDITDPHHPSFVQYVNNRNFVDAQGNILPVRLADGRTNPAVGDLGPEGLVFISAQDSPTGSPLLVVANEVSGTTSLWEVELPNYTLQILHASDHEAGIPALRDIIGFSAVLNALDARYPNTIKLASGDLFIPGPFFNASRDLYGQPGIADILVHNRLGWDVAVVGNHEFDAGTSAFYTLIAPNRNIRGVGIDPNMGYPGAAFPYLATNLDYSTDSSRLKDLVVPPGSTPKPASLTQSVVLEIGGEKIGVVGAVVPYLPQITNIGGITVLTNPNSRDVEENARLIANSVQPFVDQLVSQGINKIILMTHLQQFEVEQTLAGKLRNVDIIIGGGSHRVMANPDDVLRQDETQRPPQLLQPYPQKLKDADGKDIYLVNTGANYRYVGQLVVDFDAQGNVVNIRDDSGPYPTDIAGVNRLYPEEITTFEQVRSKADPQLVQIVDNVANFINSLDAKVYGNTVVFLNGLRESVRREETNLGNLTADANLWYARRFGVTVDISVKNGGGIRDAIGLSYIDGGTNQLVQLPPPANPATGKREGDISELDIINSLRFNNKLVVADISAQGIKDLAEHMVAAWTATATPGQFGQIGGFSFSYDPTKTPIRFRRDANGNAIAVETPGERIRNLVLLREDGSKEAIVVDGRLVVDPNRTFKMVILDFLANGGDGYPKFYFQNVTPLESLSPTSIPDKAPGLLKGSEQDALAEYLAEFYPNSSRPFNQPDTPISRDTRIQNLSFRQDTVLEGVDRDRLLFNTPIYRFRTGNGTYLYVDEEERQRILAGNYDFVEEGIAFKASKQGGENLQPIYRFRSLLRPGAYLYAGGTEVEQVRQRYRDLFVEEGLAFYVYDGSSQKGQDIYRFQTMPGAYMLVNEAEKQSILAGNFGFVNEGILFEALF